MDRPAIIKSSVELAYKWETGKLHDDGNRQRCLFYSKPARFALM